MNELYDRIMRVRTRMEEAAVKSGRRPDEIRLVGATKTRSAEVVAAALPYLDAAGENRVQEFLEKQAEGAYTGGTVDFIGHLQSNKAARVVGAVRLIQSVDSVRLARKISELAAASGQIQQVLLEVNIGRETEKSGFFAEELDEALDEIKAFPGISVKGLMTVPPICPCPEDVRKYFAEMSQLFIDIKAKKYDNITMAFLSMGMSGDYTEAILEGSNMVRIGTGIFGSRPPIF